MHCGWDSLLCSYKSVARQRDVIFIGNPLFVAPPSDFHLQPGSPAFGYGAYPYEETGMIAELQTIEAGMRARILTLRAEADAMEVEADAIADVIAALPALDDAIDHARDTMIAAADVIDPD